MIETLPEYDTLRKANNIEYDTLKINVFNKKKENVLSNYFEPLNKNHHERNVFNIYCWIHYEVNMKTIY